MPIVASELKAYASLNMPEADTGTSGGGIDVATRVEFTDMVANDLVRVVSTVADTATVSVTGRTAAGAIVTDAIVLNGATPVAGVTVFERILKIVKSAATAGTITIERNTTPFDDIITLAPAVLRTRRLFYDSASAAGATVRYEKIFLKNENATLTLNAAATKLTADPSAKVKIANAATVNDTVSVASRVTVPAGTFVDDNVSQAVPGNALAAGAAIGVWVEMSLAGGNAPIKSTFTIELAGTTT